MSLNLRVTLSISPTSTEVSADSSAVATAKVVGLLVPSLVYASESTHLLCMAICIS